MLFQRKHLSVVEKPISVFSRSAYLYLLPVFLLLGCDALNPWRTINKTIDRSEFHPFTSVCLSVRARQFKVAGDRRNIDELVLQSMASGADEEELRCVMNLLRHETFASIRSSPLVKQENCVISPQNQDHLRCVDRIIVRGESIQSRYIYVDRTYEVTLEFSSRRLEKGTIVRTSVNQAGREWEPPAVRELIP
jgi:hypothetical protein